MNERRRTLGTCNVDRARRMHARLAITSVKGLTMKQLFLTIFALGVLIVPNVYAQPDPNLRLEQSTTGEATMTEAEVRKVDKDAGKITLRHGELKNLEMPAMTMVFQVKDKAMLDKVKAGDKVRFAADKVGGAFTITQIEPVK